MNTEGAQVGAYRIVRQIGTGGMGSVWLAEHTMLGRQAAIKLLHPEYSMKPEIVMRFFNEARAAAAIADPGIVQIFDFGNHVDGRGYIVMELLDGEPLDRRLARCGAIPVGDALRIIRQVAKSLGAAHARGIVHRDLKPENIFLVHDAEVPGGERAKILDFGIAKLSNDHGAVKTKTSTLMGTPMYMSPEQCRGAGQVDQRSDVYSLGCVLFALITGRPPFEAEGSGELIMMHMTVPPPLASSRVGGVSPAVEQVIAKCLAKQPSERYGSGAELAAALGEVLGHHVGSQHNITAQLTPSAVIAVPAVTTLSTGVGSIVGSTEPPRRRRGPLIAGVAAATVVGGVIVAVLATRSSSDRAPQPTATQPETPPIATAPAKPAPPPPAPDPTTITTRRIAALLGGFAAWSKAHADAACPTGKELAELAGAGAPSDDAWNHAFTVTCTDQPANQQIGVISAGADGTPGSDDDVASWSLGHEVTAIVRGARWQPTKKPPPATASVKQPPTKRPPSTKLPSKPPPPTSSTTNDVDGDGIPDIR